MTRYFCEHCNGFFSSRAIKCPNCGRRKFTVLIPLDNGYSSQTLTCFSCKFSIKRKDAYIAHCGGSGTLWEYHFNVGQIYCWRRGKEGGGMWVHKKNSGCPQGFQSMRVKIGGSKPHYP